MPDIEEVYKEYAKQVYKYLFSLCHNEQMFSLGIEIPSEEDQEQYTSTIIIEYSDKIVKFVNGELVD